jgi:3-oxoacyl-[acyl-carrier protein] reductase
VSVMADLFDVSKEVVLVTGASQGLGRHFARLLAAQDASVVLAARQLGKLESLAREINANGGRSAPVLMDVTDRASIVKAFDAAETLIGPVSVLINNAGVVVEKAAVDQTEADWDKVLNANLKGSFSVATEFARRCIARKAGGSVINISSVLGIGVIGHEIVRAGVGLERHSRQRAGARLRRHRVQPRLLDDATGRAADQGNSAASARPGKRSRRRDPAARLAGVALHDRIGHHRRRRIFAGLSSMTSGRQLTGSSVATIWPADGRAAGFVLELQDCSVPRG